MIPSHPGMRLGRNTADLSFDEFPLDSFLRSQRETTCFLNLDQLALVSVGTTEFVIAIENEKPESVDNISDNA